MEAERAGKGRRECSWPGRGGGWDDGGQAEDEAAMAGCQPERGEGA